MQQLVPFSFICMVTYIFIQDIVLIYLCNKYIIHTINGLPSKRPNKFILFFKIRLRKFFTKKNFYTLVVIIITGYLARSFILVYWGINVSEDIFNWISIVYSFFMIILVCTIRNIADLLYPEPENTPAAAGGPAAGGGNPTGGTTNDTGITGNLKASANNGPILVRDPNGQDFVYNRGGVNQPLIGNIAETLIKRYLVLYIFMILLLIYPYWDIY